jgi:hypothetical protein
MVSSVTCPEAFEENAGKRKSGPTTATPRRKFNVHFMKSS